MQARNLSLALSNSSSSGERVAHSITPAELREQALKGTPQERAEFVRTITVPHPQFAEGLNILEETLSRSSIPDPGGVRIVGASGLGKSFICRHFLQKHPTIIGDDSVSIPILFIQLEASLSGLDLVRRLLVALGFPFSQGKNRVDLSDLVSEGMRTRNVQFLLIDEAQEFAEGRGESRASVIGNTLKRIYDNTDIPQGFLGTPLLDRFFHICDQLASRISAEHRLVPFEFDATFYGVLDAFDEALPLERRSFLSERYAHPIYQCTKGNMRALRRLLSAAVLAASIENASALRKTDLIAAFRQVFGTGSHPFVKRR